MRGDLGEGRGAAVGGGVLGGEALGSAQHLVGVDREADRAGHAVDGAGDRLADPPVGVGGHRVAAGWVEQLEAADQAEVALLDQVQHVEAPVLVALGYGDDQAQVGLHHDRHGALAGAANTRRGAVAAIGMVHPGEDALAVTQLRFLAEDGQPSYIGQIAL